MILIVSLTGVAQELYHYEFVKPIEKEVEEAGFGFETVHYTNIDKKTLGKADCVILCGTALGDNAVLEDLDRFDWLRDYGGPVLGICVGADLLSLVHGGGVEDNAEIGAVRIEQIMEDPVMGDLNGKEVYELHKLSPVPSQRFEILAKSERCTQAFRSRDGSVYGFLFHPEVRHGKIIESFCKLSQKVT